MLSSHRPKEPRIAKTAFPAPISLHNGGAFGELCLETESKEGERISAARDKLVKGGSDPIRRVERALDSFASRPACKAAKS